MRRDAVAHVQRGRQREKPPSKLPIRICLEDASRKLMSDPNRPNEHDAEELPETTFGKLDCYAITDLGRRRQSNEDQFLIADLFKSAKVESSSLGEDRSEEVSGRSQGKLMVVADGMGGHAAGQRASKLAADHALRYLVNEMPWIGDSPAAVQERLAAECHCANETQQTLVCENLRQAVKRCQKVIFDEASWNPKQRGMGTTLTMALLNWPSLYVAHVGDSRCYLLRDGKLRQLTRDHTYTQALMDAGEITASEAADSRFKNALWNVVGGNDPVVEPDVDVHTLQMNDALLLCSDGLTTHLSDELIHDVLSGSQSARAECQTLVSLANELGGNDNITAIVARFVDSDKFHQIDRSMEIDDSEGMLSETEFSLSESTLSYMNNSEA